MPEGKQLHGYVQDDPFMNWLLNQGNKLRYGKSESERMDMVNKLSAPGVKDYAYNEQGIYDPAAAERYTSAYLGGQNWKPSPGAQAAFHAFSGPSRVAMNKMGVPGVGEERPALTAAEEAGMKAGVAAPPETPAPLPTPSAGYGLQDAEIKPAQEDGILAMIRNILSQRTR